MYVIRISNMNHNMKKRFQESVNFQRFNSESHNFLIFLKTNCIYVSMFLRLWAGFTKCLINCNGLTSSTEQFGDPKISKQRKDRQQQTREKESQKFAKLCRRVLAFRRLVPIFCVLHQNAYPSRAHSWRR